MSLPPAPMKKRNLIVNYIPGYLEEEQLFALFAECGQIKSLRIMRNPDGSGKGYGFVEFYNSESAQKAIAQLDGLRLGKKRLKVAFARPGGSRDGCNLFVKNLPMTWDTSRLAEIFSRYGELLECRVLSTNDSQSRRCGFVRFNLPRNAQAAIRNMNGYIPPDGNFQIKVAPATKRYQQHKQYHGGSPSQNYQDPQPHHGSPLHQQPHQEQLQYHPYRSAEYNSLQMRQWNQPPEMNRNPFPYQYQPPTDQESEPQSFRFASSSSPESSSTHTATLAQRTLIQQPLDSNNIVNEEYSPDEQEEGSKRILLTNLPTFLLKEHVRHLCAKYGKISEINIQRDNNANSLGCAEVLFEKAESKRAALEGLDGCVVFDKTIIVT